MIINSWKRGQRDRKTAKKKKKKNKAVKIKTWITTKLHRKKFLRILLLQGINKQYGKAKGQKNNQALTLKIILWCVCGVKLVKC